VGYTLGVMEPLLAYLHSLSIILTGGFLVAELVMCRPEMTQEQRRRLPGIDVVFFVAALFALATGLLRLFFYAKGVSFYTGNPFFWVKMALFVVIAAISITPTRAFGRWKRALNTGGAPPTAPEIESVRRLLHIELGLLALMPLMAVLMARGIGR
jgi:putative membrane protein